MKLRLKLSTKDILFRQGEAGDLYLLVSGIVKVTRLQRSGAELLLNILLPGEIFPHHSLFSPNPYFGTATALTLCEVEKIPSNKWYPELDTDGRYKAIARMLHLNLRRMQQRIVVTTAPVSERLFLFREWLKEHYPEGIIEKLLTQEEIGQFLGLSRETVNRYMGALQKRVDN